MELLPCPFCGGEALPTAHLTYNWFAPVCGRCNARGPSVKIERDSDPQEMRNLMNQADENWNHRASPASAPEGWKPLTDVQWMNIVNLNHAWRNVDKEDAINEVVKLVEAKCKANNEDRLEQEITTLREQVEKLENRLNKDSQEFTILCAKETEKVLREQLATLAEQNEKMRKVLLRLACLGNGDQYGNSIGNCIAQEALSLPDLASPVLNRIRAEAMEEAAKIANEHEGVAWAVSAIRNRKAELEKSNG